MRASHLLKHYFQKNNSKLDYPTCYQRERISNVLSFASHVTINKNKKTYKCAFPGGCLRTNESAAEVGKRDDSAVEFLKHGAATSLPDRILPHTIFPWRHSPIPVDRDPPFLLGPGMPPFPLFPAFVMFVSTSNMLGSNVFKSILYWVFGNEDLSNNFAWAFSRGVSGMIADTYDVSTENIEYVQENGSIDIRFDHNIAQNSNNTHVENDEQNDVDDSNSMLQSNLIELYRSALQQHSSSLRHEQNSFHVKLQTRPLSAHIQSFYFVPFLTRCHVESNSNLEYGINAIMKSFLKDTDIENTSGMELGRKFIAKLMEMEDRLTGSEDFYNFTIVAQVSVVCREVFEVRCFSSSKGCENDAGELLQGTDGVERDVVHLVRFEKEIKFCKNTGKNMEDGSWQITDWDDILDGNIWF